MDDQQARRVEEAAQRFSEVLLESYKAAAGRTISTQELSAELTQNFFDGVIKNLRTQAEANRETIRELVDQQQRQQEAARSLARDSVNAYKEFLDSMFFFYRRSAEEVERGVGEAQNSTEETDRGAGEAQSSSGEAQSDTSEYFRSMISETNRRSAGEA
jgi:hypothetical protein